MQSDMNDRDEKKKKKKKIKASGTHQKRHLSDPNTVTA